MSDYQIPGFCILLDPGACPLTATAYFSYVKPHFDVWVGYVKWWWEDPRM